MLRSPTKRPIKLRPVRPNLGIERAYQKRLDRLIEQMNADVTRTILRTWMRRPPVMASDESPAAALRAMMARLAREWTGRFDDFATRMGRKFSIDAASSADRAFQGSLRDAGFTVKFRLTAAENDVIQATVAENVGLIRSIPQEYLDDVNGVVMRGVQVGRDAASITEALQQTYGVTQRRAAFIARDQNNKATAAITRVRQTELGITTATWLHSAGGKKPRPTHVANSGKIYNVADGWLDPAINKRIWPGTEINCRCVSIPVIPGLDD